MTPGTNDADPDSLKAEFIAYRNGDPAAFDRFYAQTSNRVWRFIASRVQGPQARDLFQEVWMKVHNSRDAYNPKYPVLAWVFTITRNTLIDSFRKHQNKEIPVISEALENSLNEQTDFSDVESAEEKLKQIFETNQTLSSEQKELLEMRYLKEWSFADIAKTLGKSDVNVRKLVSRALQTLRKQVVL